MKKMLMVFAVFAVFAAIAVITMGATMVDDDCSVPRADWQPREALARLAEENNWNVGKIESDDGCYEIEGRDRDGRRIEVEINPATLQVMELEYEDDDDDDDDDHGTAQEPAQAGTVAPPRNGLFANGAAPQVQVK